MLMAMCQKDDKIILPRNIHRSITAGLVLNGGIPIYLKPEYNTGLGIALGITPESVEDAIGEISGESIMAYPPGIPIIALGEKVKEEIVDYIKVLKEQNCSLQGPADPHIENIRVLGI